MPFTIAHTVAAPVLCRGSRPRLLASAVVVGTVAPDLEYLAHLNTDRTIGHEWWGVLVLDLPLALLLLALWHGIVKRPLADLAGPPLLPPIDTAPFPFRPLRRFVLIVASVLAGAGTHLLWDSFTHRGGFITDRIWFLNEAIGRPHVYDLVNYASTVAGVVLLSWWWWRAASTSTARPRGRPLPAGVRRRSLAVILAVTAAGGLANGARLRLDGWGLETTIVGAVLGSLAAGLVVTTAVAARLALTENRLPAVDPTTSAGR